MYAEEKKNCAELTRVDSARSRVDSSCVNAMTLLSTKKRFADDLATCARRNYNRTS